MSSIFDVLLHGTTADAQVWRLPNIKGEGKERWMGGRAASRLEAYAQRGDVDGYGSFYCVSTIQSGQRRRKEFASELPIIFTDIDFKDHTRSPEEIEATLRGLPCPPSRMHHTGNGIHTIWRMAVPFDLSIDMEMAEDLLRRICDHLGGDPSVSHCVALLRVPGTHNTKRGERRPVRLIHEDARTYTPLELDAWLGSAREPAMVRIGGPGRPTDPFTRIAESQSFKPPVDVEARLAAMTIGGEGNSSVHFTQLSCTAALMAAGATVDEAVAVVLDATRDLDGTAEWIWPEEEKNLRIMCEDFERKFLDKSGPASEAPRQIRQPPKLVGLAPSGPAPVVNLAEARDKRDEANTEDDTAKDEEQVAEREAMKERALGKVSKKLKNEHVIIGKGILASLQDEGRTILYTENQCFMYAKGLWTAVPPEDERAWASVMVERGCDANKLVSNMRIVNETRAWLQRQPALHAKEIDWDGHGFIATRSGMVDWKNGNAIRPAGPQDYATTRVECDFDPAAACPIWDRMLATDYGLDAPTVQFLQEFAGMMLVRHKPRTLMRALVLLGLSNTAKSNVLKVLAGIVSKSDDEINSTPLPTLENAHGLVSFLKPHPWVLHEAFQQGQWEMSSTVKALLSGDPVQVNIKNGPLVTLVFRQPVLWGTNVPPQFREASRAMENRLAIVAMHRLFDPKRITGTALEANQLGYENPANWVLAVEMPGLLNWAIAGLRRATERGHFEFTEEMLAALHAMRIDSNLAAGFLEECCEHSPDHFVNTGDFYGAFTTWYRDHRTGQLPSVDQLGRALKAMSDPRILIGEKISHKRVVAGLRLSDEGLDCWNGYSSSVMAERTGQPISDTDEHVNRVLSPEALQRGSFIAMQDAHRRYRGESE